MGAVWWSLTKHGSEIKNVIILNISIMKQKSNRKISRLFSWQPGENNQKITEKVLD